MDRQAALPDGMRDLIQRKQPIFWINSSWKSLSGAKSPSEMGVEEVYAAEDQLGRFSALLIRLFPELAPTQGIIESPLLEARNLQRALSPDRSLSGHWLIKGDHALPVAGCIKARGGVYEVLLHAEEVAERAGLLGPREARIALASANARALFARRQISVGSTGNLGLSIGIVSAALGFQACVHMSSDAKSWKVNLLRDRGVEVIQHEGDFSAAVAAGRARARDNRDAYFVDDENSPRLFLGYSVAALRLHRQLRSLGIRVDASHPLFVYLPCGVGGAPGGITFGLRHLFGDHVHCFFAEPVASPCMLIRLASSDDKPLSVGEVGLDNRTEADGLAVGQASEYAAAMVRSLASGVFTVPDGDLFKDLYLLNRTEGIRIEPSAAAGFRGPLWLATSDEGREYQRSHCLVESMDDATHILWTTGGDFVPDEEYQASHERGRLA
jgi:D-serine dehydratase